MWVDTRSDDALGQSPVFDVNHLPRLVVCRSTSVANWCVGKAVCGTLNFAYSPHSKLRDSAQNVGSCFVWKLWNTAITASGYETKDILHGRLDF